MTGLDRRLEALRGSYPRRSTLTIVHETLGGRCVGVRSENDEHEGFPRRRIDSGGA